MRLSKTALIVCSGLLWFLVGTMLMIKGLRWIVLPIREGGDLLLARTLCSKGGSKEQAAIVLILLALIVGFVKGRFVLAKTVARVTKRIESLPDPAPVGEVYGMQYLLLIGGMMGLGISLRWLPIPCEIKGMIDVAVGYALMHGGLTYFRLSFAR